MARRKHIPDLTLPALPALDAALAFDFEDCQRVGDDLRLLVRRRGAADFLRTHAGKAGA